MGRCYVYIISDVGHNVVEKAENDAWVIDEGVQMELVP